MLYCQRMHSFYVFPLGFLLVLRGMLGMRLYTNRGTMARKLSHDGFHLEAFCFLHQALPADGVARDHLPMGPFCNMVGFVSHVKGPLVCRDLHHFLKQDRLQGVDNSG